MIEVAPVVFAEAAHDGVAAAIVARLAEEIVALARAALARLGLERSGRRGGARRRAAPLGRPAAARGGRAGSRPVGAGSRCTPTTRRRSSARRSTGSTASARTTPPRSVSGASSLPRSAADASLDPERRGLEAGVADIRYERATRIYPGSDVAAVDALDLHIADAELMVLVGPSGSGKSTALRMLAGLEEVDDGGIWIGGRDVTYARPKDRDVAMVFQNYALYPYLTVAQNIAFPLKMHEVPRRERDLRVREVAELLGLADCSGASPASSPADSGSASRWGAR